VVKRRGGRGGSGKKWGEQRQGGGKRNGERGGKEGGEVVKGGGRIGERGREEGKGGGGWMREE